LIKKLACKSGSKKISKEVFDREFKYMISDIEELVEEACKKDANIFGYGSWSHHIVGVVKYAKLLARKLGADEEIIELAALLHDYASVLDKNLYPDHHIHGARLAEEILKPYNYSQEKIEKIKDCIFTHRASKDIIYKSVEARIIASADAMAHFDNVNSLLYLAFVKHEMEIDEGTNWVLEKLKRSWEKLMPEAREMMRKRYAAIKIILDKG